jgi:penicillin-binding protein 2
MSARLTQLTMVEGSYQRGKADNNRVVVIRTTARRGIFFDRHGVTLVHNNPLYKRQVPGTTIHEARFVEISRDEALKLQYQDGERVFYDIVRQYPLGKATAHLLGYTGEINEKELTEAGPQYILGDRLGKTGLEKWYEWQVRGKAGSTLMEVDARGETQRVVGKLEEVPGVDIELTLDSGLQSVLYDALSGVNGAAVARVPKTGEILAMVSTPAYDPNDVGASLTSPNQPFFNRAIGGGYAPGSVFKIVTAVAALEEDKINHQTTFEDTGEIKIDSYRYGNWLFDQYGRTEGQVDVTKGLQRSNDIFFYRAGEAVGAEKLAEWAKLFGFGSQAGLQGLGESTGLVPDPNWKSKYKGEKWFLGDTYHMAIGQGDVLTTPLQVNRMMAAVAQNGLLCPPILNKKDLGRASCQQLNLKPDTVQLLHEGLVKVCEPGGTGVAFFNFSPKVACKTGTAQEGGVTTNPHAWFTVYAPADNPQIALTILVENGGQGSEVASPIARKALDWWFRQPNPGVDNPGVEKHD